MIDIFEGDNRAHLARLIEMGVQVHSVVTDPPYGLTSITKRFASSRADDGTKTSARIAGRTDGFARVAAGGFMGSKWDGTGIERDPEFWALVYEILLPGGYCVAFSGSRTGHWQACAMEMAGFVMHPMLGWVFGQGFPKAHNASKAIDATLLHGSSRTTDIRQMDMGEGYAPSGRGRVNFDHGTGSKMNGAVDAPGPRTPEAAQWEGWAYGGQALKPALEPIYVGQKPFAEKNGALNLLKHGVGAINIDGCRVNPGEMVPGGGRSKRGAAAGGSQVYGEGESAENAQPHNLGRHPANLLHDGSPEVIALFPQTTSGVKQGGHYGRETGVHEGGQRKDGTSCFGDTGSAARFFNSFPPDADPVFYQPKAGKADRAGSKHPTVKPIALMRWLVRLVTPPGGTVLDPFAGSGTTGEAAKLEGFDATLIEAEPDYAAFLKARFRRDDPPGLAGDIFG